jgi:hypothetical protein
MMVHEQCYCHESRISSYATAKEIHSEAFADDYPGAFPDFPRPGEMYMGHWTLQSIQWLLASDGGHGDTDTCGGARRSDHY